MIAIIGIDPSVSNTGISLLEIENDKIIINDCFNILSQTQNIDKAMYDIEKSIYSLCYSMVFDCGAEFIFYEKSNFFVGGGSSSITNIKLQYIYGLIAKNLYAIQQAKGKINNEYSLKYESLLSNSVKCGLLGKTQRIKKTIVTEITKKPKLNTKKAVQQYIKSLIESGVIIKQTEKRLDENIIDAIAVAIVGGKRYNLIQINVENNIDASKKFQIN